MQERLPAIDSDRAAALDVLLLLADSRAEERRFGRALALLDDAAEAAAGHLPAEYEMKRLQWLVSA